MSAHRSKFVAEFRERLKNEDRQIDEISKSADAVAQRWVESRHTLMHFYPGGNSSGFMSEQCCRAGGLDNAQVVGVRRNFNSTNDVFLAGPRSWEKIEVGKGYWSLPKHLATAKTNGWMTILFASRNGLPTNLPIDCLIDNGASSGADAEAPLNQIVNATHAWMWECELTAALTRRGWRPGVLKGMLLPGATEHNKLYQIRNDPKLYPCSTPIPAGRLAHEYLKAVDAALDELESPAQQRAIARAADYAVERLKAGHTVWASSITHMLDTPEIVMNLQSPMKGFAITDANPVGSITNNVKAGDLFFYFGEWTINIPGQDFLAVIRSTKADYIPSFRLTREPMEPFPGHAETYDVNVKDSLMVLEQHWPYEGAVVSIPFPPEKMAPISGVYVALMYRMLDEAIADRLAAEKTVATVISK